MTASSLITLASTLDRIAANGSFVNETADAIIVSELSAPMAIEVSRNFAVVAWQHVVFDGAGNETAPDEIADDFSPYRVTARKPPRGNDEVLLLTASGFQDWLTGIEQSKAVVVIGLNEPIATESTQFLPLDAAAPNDPQPATFRSPRTLVREYGAHRVVPQSIGRWLLSNSETWNGANVRFQVWAEHAVRALMLSLPNEIDQDTSAFVFKGPPRLSLSALGNTSDLVAKLGRQGFGDLQATARWVYELDREAEMRHTLFATEFARTGGSQLATIPCFKENLGFALEGAKIAYAMSLARVSADNLKALADLRKAVTEETAKITDATRQVVAAIASALGIGVGLIAARVAANAPALLVVAVMAIVCAYIFVVIYSGHSFAALNRRLRDVWRSQIYRFLSEEDYTKMVVQPGRDAEKILKVVSWVGGIAVAVTFAVTLWVAFVLTGNSIVPQTAAEQSTPAPRDAIVERSAAPAPASQEQIAVPNSSPSSEIETQTTDPYDGQIPETSGSEVPKEVP